MKKQKITKKAISYYNRLKATANTELNDVYKKPSHSKISAFYDCKCEYVEANGFNFRIIGASKDFFTVAWLTKTDEGLFINVRTAYNSYRYLVESYVV